MISVADAQEKVGRAYDRLFPEWALRGAEPPVVDIPLYPPTQQAALEAPREVQDWIQNWRIQERNFGPGARLNWESRQGGSVGSQRVPTGLVLQTPDQAAAFLDRSAHWKAAQNRCAELRSLLEGHARAPESAAVETVPDVLRRRMKKLTDLDRTEYLRLRDALSWLLENPTSGVYPRQMPIRGVDSKWLEQHASLVEPLYAVATGSTSLGLLEAPRLVRIRALDPALAPGGVGDFAAPVDEISRWDVTPAVVLMVENLHTFLALPELERTLAVHSSAYAARNLARIPWLSETRIIYWGDLDVDGFRILSMVRSVLGQTESALMDRATLTAHWDLAGPDRKDAPRGLPEHLTAAERDAFAALGEHGQLRLEQERIPWDYAVGRLHRMLNRR